MKQVAIFDYNQRTAADEKVADLLLKKEPLLSANRQGTNAGAGRSKGFGFVEMGSDQEAPAAIAALNGQDSGGRIFTVNEARPKPKGSRGGSGDRGGYRW